MIGSGSRLAIGHGAEAQTTTVTCLLRVGAQGRPSHVLTAGHGIPRDGTGLPVRVLETNAGPSAGRVLGTVTLNLLDSTHGPLDAALVELQSAALAKTLSSAGPRFRSVRAPLHGAVTTPWLPSRRGIAGAFRLGKPLAAATFRSPIRPDGFSLSSLASVPTLLTNKGDSGAPLLLRDTASLGGLLVGRYRAQTVFQPVLPVLAALEDALGCKVYVLASR